MTALFKLLSPRDRIFFAVSLQVPSFFILLESRIDIEDLKKSDHVCAY